MFHRLLIVITVALSFTGMDTGVYAAPPTLQLYRGLNVISVPNTSETSGITDAQKLLEATGGRWIVRIAQRTEGGARFELFLENGSTTPFPIQRNTTGYLLFSPHTVLVMLSAPTETTETPTINMRSVYSSAPITGCTREIQDLGGFYDFTGKGIVSYDPVTGIREFISNAPTLVETICDPYIQDLDAQPNTITGGLLILRKRFLRVDITVTYQPAELWGYGIVELDAQRKTLTTVWPTNSTSRMYSFSQRGKFIFAILYPRNTPPFHLDNREYGKGQLARLTPTYVGLTNFSRGVATYGISPDGRKLVICAYPDGELDQEVFIINQDGSGFRRLTNNGVQDYTAYFSLDGETIFFSSDMEGVGDLYQMNLDGSNLRRVQPATGG